MLHPDDDRWIAYALGEAEPEEAAALEEHRRDCTACSTECGRLLQLLEAARDPGAETLPLHGFADLVARQADLQRPPRWRPAARAAGLLGLAALLFFAGDRHGRRAGSAASVEARAALPPPPRLPYEVVAPAVDLTYAGDLAAWPSLRADSITGGDSL